MLSQKKQTKLLRKTSIRERVGLALACIDYYMKHVEDLDSETMRDIMDDFWHFTATDDLCYWESKCLRNLNAIAVNGFCSPEVAEMLETALELGRFVADARDSRPMAFHTANCAQLILVLRGAIEMEISGCDANERLGPGDWRLVAKGSRYGLRSMEDQSVWLAFMA